MSTNITREHREIYEALVSGRYGNFALFSCFVDGEPTSAIVTVHKDGGQYDIRPVFIAVTAGMLDRITDHDGITPTARPEWQGA